MLEVVFEINISNPYSLRHRGTQNGLCGIEEILGIVMSVVIMGQKLPGCEDGPQQ